MKKLSLLSSMWLVFHCSLFAQVGINTDNSMPHASALLDVKSTSKGFLPPRMTFSQRNAIASPSEGLLVICTNCKADGNSSISIYLDGQWLNLTGSCDTPASPQEGNHIEYNTQIMWDWNSTPIATGYKWGLTEDYAAATDMGTITSKFETGLTTGTIYTRYVWAYNACGHSASPTILTALALACGTSYTVHHTGGDNGVGVAPYTKTVSYETVTDIPGETSKCWIAHNLGATNQATSVSDATWLSAGWYWQFNRKQGYSYAGGYRYPIIGWDDLISENSGWTAENDPCKILLGTLWRLPTDTEWNNVDVSGGWTDWNAPFNSGLKLHAGGYLGKSDGTLTGVGSYGHYWSSTPSNTYAHKADHLYFMTGYCANSEIEKAYGYTIRCLKE
jgi:hypothetical protein